MILIGWFPYMSESLKYRLAWRTPSSNLNRFIGFSWIISPQMIFLRKAKMWDYLVPLWLHNWVKDSVYFWSQLCGDDTSPTVGVLSFGHKTQHTDFDWLYTVVQLPVTCISMYSCNHLSYSTLKTCICWWIIRVNKKYFIIFLKTLFASMPLI